MTKVVQGLIVSSNAWRQNALLHFFCGRYIISGWLNPLIIQWLDGKEQEALEHAEAKGRGPM
jgi:hypothetical protein